MNFATKMFLMNNSRDRKKDGEHPRRDDRYRESGYAAGPEDRFRDRRGREHYDDGRYAPQANYGGPGPEYYQDNHFTPRYGRDIGPEKEMHPPRMNKIGFSAGGEIEPIPDEYRQDYHSTVSYPHMNEFEHRRGEYMPGYGSGSQVQPMNKETAQRWVEGMKNEDGSTGPHWTMEQAKQIQSQKDIDCDPVHFWVAINMAFSDYSKVAKKLNVNNSDFYACMAEAFLTDKDAQPDKLERYYQFVVKH